ncbi:hypothetical protein CBR_g44296 [Chara braunii]|uniref:Peptidase A2 domain-containing protein n=1 Tax=Chara braunii TaxID=69332 RepID=A0A388K2X8_CHABU|nr:hypothetical protein CBR_g44296 [Chara braunii]|eukprot:GBG64412.1 hypothetical protein CBR_g44296 [Chara braunii]
MLYRLLKQQKEDHEKEEVSADKDQAVYKTLTDMRNMMADMKEERLKLQIELEAAMESLTIEDAKVGDEGLSKKQEEVLQRARSVIKKMNRCREACVQVCADMNEEWPGLPQVFLFGGWDRDGQGGLTDVTTSQPGSSLAGRLMATTILSRPAFKRLATAGLPQARRARKPPRPRAIPEEGPSQPRETETIPIEEDDGEEDELLRAEDERQAKQRAMEREPETGKTDVGEGELKKKKQVYTIPVEQGLDIEQIVDRILESQRDLFTLKEFLAASPKLQEEFIHRLSRKKVMTVKMSDIFPQEISWAPPGTKMDWHCVATGLLKVQVGPCEYSALIDDGAEMNIIREREAMGAGVNINGADTGFLVGASGITPFCGTASDVTIQVGKVKVRSYFFVLPRIEHAVLLGRAFLCPSESIIFNKHDGTIIAVLCDPVCDYYEVMKCENTGPTNSRNRLRREKESLGEESDPHEFFLALPNISQAIEFVATDSSLDPKLVQTLTEIVAGEGGTGRMYLTYRPDRSSEGDVLTEPAAKQGLFLEVDDLELEGNASCGEAVALRLLLVFWGGAAEALPNFCGNSTCFLSGTAKALQKLCGGSAGILGGTAEALPELCGGSACILGGTAEALPKLCGDSAGILGGTTEALPNPCSDSTDFLGGTARVLLDYVEIVFCTELREGGLDLAAGTVQPRWKCTLEQKGCDDRLVDGIAACGTCKNC